MTESLEKFLQVPYFSFVLRLLRLDSPPFHLSIGRVQIGTRWILPKISFVFTLKIQERVYSERVNPERSGVINFDIIGLESGVVERARRTRKITVRCRDSLSYINQSSKVPWLLFQSIKKI